MATETESKEATENEKPQGGRIRPVLICSPGRTKQEFKKESLMKTIMDRYNKGEFVESRRMDNPRYGDFSSGADYHQVCNQVLAAKAEFMELPAKIRDRFHNDPGNLLEFLGNPENAEEALKLGLTEPSPSEAKEASPTPEKPAEKPAESDLEIAEKPPTS